MAEITIRVLQENFLEDNAQWTNRFLVRSSSGKDYVISQHKTRRHWGCACRGWTAHRNCKHLKMVGLPANEVPCDNVRIEIIGGGGRLERVIGNRNPQSHSERMRLRWPDWSQLSEEDRAIFLRDLGLSTPKKKEETPNSPVRPPRRRIVSKK